MNVLALKQKIKIHLESDTLLSFIEAVEVRQYTRGAFPEFENYAILVSTRNTHATGIAQNLKAKNAAIDIVCVCRNFDWTGSVIGEPPNQVGIEYMVKHIQGSLYQFLETQTETISLTRKELNGQVDFDRPKFPERADYYHEVVVPLNVEFSPKSGGI
jgi:hypothetical protein